MSASIPFDTQVCYNGFNQQMEAMYITELEAIRARHSVRQYLNKPLKPDEPAPTAVNQQKFLFTLEDGKVSAIPGHAFYVKMDLGIVKYHFEM